MQQIKGALSSIVTVVQTIRLVDFLDIVIVALLFYAVLMMVHGSRAAQLFKGIILLIAANALAASFQMRVLGTILSAILQIGVLALIVVFQPEIRRALEQIGHGKIMSLDFLHTRTDSEELLLRSTRAIAAVCDAAEQMSASRTGALIVFERKSNLKEIMGSGTMVNADVSVELLNTIFYEGTLLHDGATIIREGRVAAAGCVLPLSDNLEISKEMGTRHRAALGMSENSDAVVVVVSEESGIISLCREGVLVRRLDRASLYKILTKDVLSEINLADKEKARQAKVEKITDTAKRIGRLQFGRKNREQEKEEQESE